MRLTPLLVLQRHARNFLGEEEEMSFIQGIFTINGWIEVVEVLPQFTSSKVPGFRSLYCSCGVSFLVARIRDRIDDDVAVILVFALASRIRNFASTV